MSTKDLLVTNKEKVREKWGKTASEVDTTVSILKQWLGKQQHLPEIPDDNTIEFILTNCKYSIEKTKQHLDMYYTVRTLLPEYFENSHPLKSNLLKSVAKMGHFVVLPKLTDSLCRVTLLRYSDDAEAFDISKVSTYLCNTFEVRLREDLEMGEIFVHDLTDATMAHALKFNATAMKNFLFLVENYWSSRIKEIHLINYPPFVDIVLKIVKLIVKKKLYDRIHLHNDMESFYKYIPQEMLPSDYGGNEKSLQELTDLWQLKFKECEKRFDQLEEMKVNETLRPEPLLNSDILGYHGNFTKLDVD